MRRAALVAVCLVVASGCASRSSSTGDSLELVQPSPTESAPATDAGPRPSLSAEEAAAREQEQAWLRLVPECRDGRWQYCGVSGSQLHALRVAGVWTDVVLVHGGDSFDGRVLLVDGDDVVTAIDRESPGPPGYDGDPRLVDASNHLLIAQEGASARTLVSLHLEGERLVVDHGVDDIPSFTGDNHSVWQDVDDDGVGEALVAGHDGEANQTWVRTYRRTGQGWRLVACELDGRSASCSELPDR